MVVGARRQTVRRTSRNVAVIGAGYVGLTAAACLARLGHRVWCTDALPERVELLRSGTVPMVEGGLGALVREGLQSGRLQFGNDNTAAVRDAEFVFLCVPTPQGSDGTADLSFVLRAAEEVGPHLKAGAVVINKSTVPVGTTRLVHSVLDRADVSVVSNPEFLREGSAVTDFLNPDRVVIGGDDEDAVSRVSALYGGIAAPVLLMDAASAELVKYASNAFLATKVSFINSIAALCERLGADVRHVSSGMGSDARIGAEFLTPGPGWGGSCFPKDSAALVRIAEQVGFDFTLLQAARVANELQYQRIADRVEALAGGSVTGRRVALWGLTFKAHTDDTRRSPSLEIAARLRARGARVLAYDPTAHQPVEDVEVCSAPADACEGASVLVIGTEWPEFRDVDLQDVASRMERPAILDARNVLDAAIARRAGFRYEGIGLPIVGHQVAEPATTLIETSVA